MRMANVNAPVPLEALFPGARHNPDHAVAVCRPPLPLPESRAQVSDQSHEASDSQHQSKTAQNGASPSEPFPLLELPPLFQYNATLHPIDTSSEVAHPKASTPHAATPSSAGLRIQTDHLPEKMQQLREESKDQVPITETPGQQTVFNAGLPVRTSSIRSICGSRPHRNDSLSPGSGISSPSVGPLADLTPLPSPISLWGSPKTWKASTINDEIDTPADIYVMGEASAASSRFTPLTRIPSKRRKVPHVVGGSSDQDYDVNAACHALHRSISDYVPDGMPVPKSRNVVVSISGATNLSQAISPPDDYMHREQYLAVQRGLAVPKLPTPPDSNHGRDSLDQEFGQQTRRPGEVDDSVIYEARTLRRGQIKRWQTLRILGKGEFSRVYLATSEFLDSNSQANLSLRESEVHSNSLVAVKIAEHGPAGGADEQKVETSIRREVKLMKSVNHPSLVHLKAVEELDRRTIIVENYCAGGDLFDLASQRLEALTSSLIRRIFAELVSAVQYLHLQYIVHRDIKLENVLVNLPAAAIAAVTDWQTYTSPVVTLTDLGLGRWIPTPPASPFLTTRCGSEDYAAPEVLLGDEYDGRSTDAWALGVLLYAIMEGRLPFDPIPGSRRKTPTSHRIARCDWQWLRYANDDAEWDVSKGKDVEGAARIVEGLVAKRRSRWTLAKVQETEWVTGGIVVSGGLKTHDELDEEDY